MAALRAASIDISHTSCRKTLVMLAMANGEALQHTVPLFLQSLGRTHLTAGRQAGQPMSRHLVLVCWSEEAVRSCRALQEQYGHQCVLDTEHTAASGSFGFHDDGFNSLGFAKIKYILNGLSAGHDTLFLDTDILALRDPLPYLLSRKADVFGAMEKCQLYNDSHALASPEFLALGVRPPGINIGVLYFRATAGVTRCVYSWMWAMLAEAQARPRVWDQDVFGKIVTKCTAVHGLRLQVLDPRLFQSACYPACGCSFTDDALAPGRLGKFSRGARPLVGGRCGPQHWEHWLLRHFPCSGLTKHKAQLMSSLLEGFHSNSSRKIT